MPFIDRVYPRVCGGTPTYKNASGGQAKVYPRVCGGTMVAKDLQLVESPRGSIPACAGEPNGGQRGHRCMGEVYPRVCGGTPWRYLRACAWDRGLSPRVRGNPNYSSSWAGLQLARSIPACAGEPRLTGDRFTFDAVYPRVCGGTCTGYGSARTSLVALSPRVRGNLLHQPAVVNPIQPGLSPRVRGNRHRGRCR